jgi:hypothetical protein
MRCTFSQVVKVLKRVLKEFFELSDDRCQQSVNAKGKASFAGRGTVKCLRIQVMSRQT